MSLSMTRRAVVLGAGASLITARTTYGQATPDASPAAGAFPVSIDHVYGTTVIESAPQRIVTLGWSSYDAIIALGIVPVAIPFFSWGGDADGFFPWTREAIGDRPLPTMLDTSDGVPFEAIIAVSPDVILAPYSGYTEEEYVRLSEIAPTVPFSERPWSGSWQDLTLVCGQALGLLPEAEQLIADTDRLVAERAAEYPALAGASYIYGNVGDGTTAFNIYTTSDPRPLFLDSMGLVPSEFQKSITGTEDLPYAQQVSFERASELIADVVVFWFSDQAEYDAAVAQPFLELIPAVPEGRLAAIIGQTYVMATSAFSPLSIPYALDEFLPTLNAAAENVVS